MIERYTLQRMKDVWEEENKFRKWLEIELLVMEAFSELKLIPKEDLEEIRKRASFSVERIKEIERRTKHDVAAFVDCVSESLGPYSRYLHMGLTSSDIIDTSFSLLLRDAADILIEDILQVLHVLRELSFKYKDVPIMGRTHGIHAEPITFGIKMAHFYDEMRRNLKRMERAREAISYGKISGAVGTYTHVDPFVEEYVCRRLGLKPVPISSQIIPRDYYGEFFVTLAIVASSVEKMALEVRNLQRTEVQEVEEAFEAGQKGSSAMPHKRNPIGSENLCGLARLLRSYALSALENIALWHERDISHSSVERVIGPDSTILLDFMLQRVGLIYRNLFVYPERMRRNMEATKGLYHSESLLTALVKKGLERKEAYTITQEIALRCFENGLDFREEVRRSGEVRRFLSAEEIDEALSDEKYIRHIDTIFERVFS
jgi:adenylosuccinate lyase